MEAAAERAPPMTISLIEASLLGQQPVDPDELSESELEILLASVAAGPLTPHGQAFYDKLNADGLGIGMTEVGNLVYGLNEQL